MPVELIAEATFADPVGPVVASDRHRAHFAATVGHTLCALSGDDLTMAATWPLDTDHPGAHSVRPDKGFALLSGPASVRLVHRNGPVWKVSHPPWSGDFEAGCAWFDHRGRPFALVPSPDYDGCRILALSRADGTVVAEAEIDVAPASALPVHQRDGWVGLAVVEGHDRARAWWVSRPAGGDGALEVTSGTWRRSVLTDVDPSGHLVLTAPQRGGTIAIRSFPDLDVRKRVAPPRPGSPWDSFACFAGDRLVARVLGEPELTVAVGRDGGLEALDVGPGRLVPAAHGTWLTVERNRVRRWRLG